MQEAIQKYCYYKSPRIIQNFALGLYGYRNYRSRFSGSIPIEYASEFSLFNPPGPERYDIQNQRFRQLLWHSASYVPFYKELLSGVNIQDVSVGNMSKYIPKITKEEILQSPGSFRSTHPVFNNSYINLYTSGSSGTPLHYISSYEGRRINYHYYNKILKEYSCNYRSRSTTLAGRVLYKKSSAEVARYDRFNNTQYLSSYGISDSSIVNYVRALNFWKPLFIDSYPSALSEIVALAIEKGLEVEFKPNFILTSSETLSITQRQDFENFFGCDVVDHYGCTEMCVSAVSNGGYYYSDPAYSIIEYDEKHGDSFSLVCTGLLNFAMPIFRYDIGDLAKPVNESCSYVFSKIEGRLDDTILTPEGNRIGRLDPAFKGVSGIKYSQVVQRSLNDIEVNVVLSDSPLHKFDESILIDNLKSMTSPSIFFRINYTKKIEREINGKFKSVVSLLVQK